MFLKSLELKNFGIVEDANLQFGKGFNLLMGNTGNGKSTVLKALAYLLVNFTPNKIEDFLNWNKDDFFTKMIFSHEGLPFEYGAKFFRTGNKSERDLRVGSDNPYFASDATKRMADFFDPNLCKAAILSFQNEADLVTLDPAKRRDLLKKIYNLDFQNQIDLIKQEIENLTKKAADTENAILVLKTRIAGYKIEELEPLPFEELDYRLKQDLLLKLNDELSSITNAIKEWTQIKRDILDKREAIAKYRLDQKNATATMEQAQAQINQYNDTLSKDTFYVKRDKLWEDLKQDFEKVKRGLESELSQIVLTRIPKFDEEELKIKREEFNKISNDSIRLQEKMEALQSQRCPICGKTYSQEEIKSDMLYGNNLSIVYERLENQIKELEQKKIDIQKQKEDQIALALKKQMIQGKIENEVRMIQQKKLTITSQLEAEEKSIRQIKEAIRLRIQIETEKLNAAKARQTVAIVAIGDKEKEIRNLEVRLPDKEPSVDPMIRIQIDTVTAEIDNFKAIVIRNQQIEARNIMTDLNKKSDTEKLEKAIASKAIVLQDIENQKAASTIYKIQFPNFVIADMIEDIEKGVNSFLDKAYEGRYHVSIKESKTGLSIVYGPRDKDISTVASGGEIDLFNVGLKIAFCKLSGMKVLILDEIDKYFDDEIAISTFSIINEMLHNGDFEQVFVISHKNEVKDVVEQFGAKVFDFQKGVVTSY